ncbi:MAG TPA: hypothetical protein VHW46_03370 [Terracidiphilus sp.]|nr:hypothetical protein [Terracidiphilus sp.]
MTGNRQRYAWVWLAVAAITVATCARAQAGLPRTTALANPVLAFLSAHAQSEASSTPVWAYRSGSARVQRTAHSATSDTWMVFLPVLFIGLVVPLNLLSSRAALSVGRTPPAPALPFLFQRPPPSVRFAL